ncbi:hypothetical protein C8T65DRAFT_831476, partial [Cerioporus squamosus]
MGRRSTSQAVWADDPRESRILIVTNNRRDEYASFVVTPHTFGVCDEEACWGSGSLICSADEQVCTTRPDRYVHIRKTAYCEGMRRQFKVQADGDRRAGARRWLKSCGQYYQLTEDSLLAPHMLVMLSGNEASTSLPALEAGVSNGERRGSVGILF